MAAPNGISFALADEWNVADPTWTRIDTTYNVQGWTIDRGRSFEQGKTGTGTASIELIDKTGAFDPTNTGGAFYGTLTAMTQAAIALQNPVTSAWSTLFRGFVSRVRWVPYRNLEFANVTIDLVDGLAVMAAAEMPLDYSFGETIIDGNVVFLADTGTDACQTRINLVLDQLDYPSSLREIFTGNVKLQQTTYAPRSSVLQVIQDCGDAEFPDVANFFIGKDGTATFHGRFARFDPTNPDYDITAWQTGDAAAVAANTATVVYVSPPLEASLDDSTLYTSALATPQNIADADIAGQYVTANTATADFGLRTWSAENLITGGGTATSAKQETKLFATYVTDNYLVPRLRVSQLTVLPRDPGDARAAATWALMCGVDISDTVHLKTTHTGGGGFDDDFYVEGVHYEARPASSRFKDVTLTLDVSPAGYYDSNPF